MFSDVNDTIAVFFKALKRGWLPTTNKPTQQQWVAYKKSKAVSAQKSFIGYTLGFGGQYFGGARVREYRDNKKFYKDINPIDQKTLNSKLEKLLNLDNAGTFKLNLKYFMHHKNINTFTVSENKIGVPKLQK